MKNLRKFLAAPIMLVGLAASCLSPLSIKADDSSAGYIDAGWEGHHQISQSKLSSGDTQFDHERNNKWNNLGFVDEMWMTKDGQKIDPVYCYNAERKLPNAPKNNGTTYDRYGFFYGMNNRATDLGSDLKVQRIAATLFVGYPNDGLNGRFDGLAQQSFNAIKSDSFYNDKVGANYTIDQFKQDVTQEVIWYIDDNMGAGSTAPKALVDASVSTNPNTASAQTVAAYGKAIYDYVMANPLTEEAADARNLQVIDKSGNPISSTNKLVADVKNGGFTQEFSIKGFAGAIHITPDADWEVYDAATNQKVNNSQLMMGTTYKLKYVGTNTATNSNINLKANYKTLADSYFFQPKDKVLADGSSWQNLVCLHTKDTSTDIPATLKTDTKTTDVKFNKFEVTGSKELAGAHMQVIDKASGKVVEEWDSTTGGIDHTFKAEEGKDYILKETVAPSGYDVIATTEFKVENGKIQLNGDTNVKVDGKDSTLVLINDRELSKVKTTTTTDVKFNKYEATGSKELAGAHMQVIDKASGKVVAEWTSNANGIDHTFRAEEGKEYILRETIAPKGYKTIADTTFVVRNGKIQLTGDTNVKINGTDTNLLMINDQLLARANNSNNNNNNNDVTASRVIKNGTNEMVSTGDNSNVAGLIALGLGSLVVLGICLTRKQNA